MARSYLNDFHRYCAVGQLEIVKQYLQNIHTEIERKKEIEMRDCNERETPLGSASRNGHKEIVSLLLEYGANIEVYNH